MHAAAVIRMQSCAVDRACVRCAGILSSYGEMEHMAQGRAKLLPFDPFAKQPKMSYKVRGMPCLPLPPLCSDDPSMLPSACHRMLMHSRGALCRRIQLAGRSPTQASCMLV